MIHVTVWDFRGGFVCMAIFLAAALTASKTAAEEEASLMAKLYWDRSVLRSERDEVLTVSAMWDPSLWEQYAQPGTGSAHYHMSPEGFRRVCEDVKELTDALPEDSLARRMILVDNWNEWGEGHYLAPCREHGFEYLDVLRRVFTSAEEHTDLLPEDVGLGPYETAYETWLDEMRKAPAPPQRKATSR